MTLPAITVMVEAVFVVLLLVTIVYAVKLNKRISDLRERDKELREMMEQFNQASIQARDSVEVLKSAGIDVERRLAASIDRAQVLRDDLARLIREGEPAARHPRRRAPKPVTAAADGDDTAADDRFRSEIEQALAREIRSTALAG